MKKLNMIPGILIIVLLASSLYAQDTDEILANHFEAINQKKLNTVQSIKIEAKMSMMGQDMPMTVMQKRPSKMRSDITMQGMKISTVYNGKEGWMINPMMGSSEPQKIPAEQLENTVSQSNFFDSELYNYEEKGHTLEKLEDAEVLGKSAYVFQLNHKNDMKIKFHIDKESYLIVKTSVKVNQRGMEMEVESIHKDYKKVDDIIFAHNIEVHSNGQLFQSTIITSVELNNEYDDSLFEKASLAE